MSGSVTRLIDLPGCILPAAHAAGADRRDDFVGADLSTLLNVALSVSKGEAGGGGQTHFFTVAIQILPWRSVIAKTSPEGDMSSRCGLSAVDTICWRAR